MPYTPDIVAKEADLPLRNADKAKARPRSTGCPTPSLPDCSASSTTGSPSNSSTTGTTLPDYSHGFLVPFFAAFLIWDKRKVLSTTLIKPTWSGLVLIVFAIGVLVLGVYGVELFTARMSFIFLLAGLIWTFFGRAMLRALRFPLLVLRPGHSISRYCLQSRSPFPLQLLASRIASDILPILGVPTLHEGNVIELPIMKLEVAEACSGIRSLMSLFTLAVFYGYFLERTTKRRVILALASIPIAVTANVVRIVGTGLCVQYWDPDKALGFFHEFSGWVMFVVSLACLYLVHRACCSSPS